MKKVKCLIAITMLLVVMISVFSIPAKVSAAGIENDTVEPRYSVIKCIKCGSAARYIQDIIEAGILYGEFYCWECNDYFYLEK